MAFDSNKNLISHNSRLISDRDPQGAVVCGSTVRIRLYVPEAAYAILRLKTFDQEQLIDGNHSEQGFYEFLALMPSEPGLVHYSFIINDKHSLKYYGGKSGIGSLYDSEPPHYQITVYKQNYAVPKWFGRGIVYQIFPDRFCGSTQAFDRVEYHTRLGRGLRLHQSWDEPVEYLPKAGEADYVPNDFYGGDLKGIIEKLPYLQALGITCIYLNPIFESRSNHRYDTADYMRLDPMLGEPSDFMALCDAARKLNIRVILDGVFSHTGADSIYFNKYGSYDSIGAYQSKLSRYFSWYTFFDWPESYKSWWGFKSLPEADETNADYIKYITGGKGVLEHWLNQGASGWRLDVADELPDWFIRCIREKVKTESEDNILIGEVWEDASAKVSMGMRRKYVDGNELDSVTNYPLRAALIDFFCGNIDAYCLNATLAMQRENYPEPFYYSLLNILGSHDTERIINALSGSLEAKAMPLTRAEQARHVLSAEEYKLGKKRLLACSGLIYNLPGTPCIYYGDEAGLTGLKDPFNRGTYPWGKQDMEIVEHFKRLGALRQTYDCISRGLCALSPLDEEVFSVVRFINEGLDAFKEPAKNGCAITIVNRSQSVKSVSLCQGMYTEGPDAKSLRLEGEYTDAFSGKRYIDCFESLKIELEPLDACLLIRQNEYI